VTGGGGVEAMLVVEPDALETIRRHGAETYPHECCGALVGRLDGADAAVVVEALPLPNTTEEGPRRRFLVRPADYRAAERHAAARRAELVGFYHSHPDAPARPSAYDLEHAWPVFRYVIVSVAGGRPGELTCWRLRDDRSGFDREELSWRTRS
jgi:proteasome lid subunit RPN8/RPN11